MSEFVGRVGDACMAVMLRPAGAEAQKDYERAVKGFFGDARRTEACDLRDALGRAALGAAREPTEEMMDALASGASCEGYPENGWKAAIDASLK